MKIMRNFWLLAFLGFIVFVVITFALSLPSRILIGEKGQAAIQMLDAMRRPFLEIKKEETLLFWPDDITRPTISHFKMDIESGNTLLTKYRQLAEYNPELSRRVAKLSEAYANWISAELKLLEHFHRGSLDEYGRGVNEQILRDMNTASALFLYTMNQLGDGEIPIHEDISNGRMATRIILTLLGLLFLYLMGLIFLQQRSKARELALEVAMKTADLKEANKSLLQEVIERTEAQRETEKALSLQYATLESTADGILVVNNEGKITSFNKRFTDMWLIPESIVASRDDNQALAFVLEQLKDPEGFLAKVRELYSQPYAESDDVLEFKDGRVFERYSRPQLIGGKNVGRVWSFRDVTERRKIEKELVSRSILTTELIKLNKMKSQFLANVSHELRTPMNSIMGFSELLREKSFGELNEKQMQYVNYINTSGSHLLQLINNILDMSKVEAGRLELEPEEFPLADVLGEVLNIVGPIAQKKSVVIESKAVPVSTKVILDRAKFKQIMLNLVSNAVKFNKGNGKVSIYWDISEEAKGDILERILSVSVKDTGIGIKAEDIPRVFMDFEQLDPSSTREYGGTGLGMALTKKLVELHGGRIWVESEYGKGTQFSIIIPQSSSGPRQA